MTLLLHTSSHHVFTRQNLLKSFEILKFWTVSIFILYDTLNMETNE